MSEKKAKLTTNRKMSIFKYRLVWWITLIGGICSVAGLLTYIMEKVIEPPPKPTQIFNVSKRILSERGVPSYVSFPDLESLKDIIHPTSYDMLKVYLRCHDLYLLDKIHDIEKNQLEIVSLVFFLKGAHELEDKNIESAIHYFTISLKHDTTNIFSLSYLHFSIEQKISNIIINCDHPSEKDWVDIQNGVSRQKEIQAQIEGLEISNISKIYLTGAYLSFIQGSENILPSIVLSSNMRFGEDIDIVKNIVETTSLYSYKKGKFDSGADESSRAIELVGSREILDGPNGNVNGKLICVGLDHYAASQGLPPLKYAASDAYRFANQLARDGFEIELLINNDATKEKILNTIEAVTNSTTSEMNLMFYFAGHGICDKFGDKYIMCYSDAGDDFKLPIESIKHLLSRSKSKSFGIFDTCFKYNEEYINNDFRYQKKSNLINKYPIMLYASDSFKSAYESEELKSGLLTYALVDYLKNRKKYRLNIEEMYQLASSKTEDIARIKYNIRQSPKLANQLGE